MLDVSHKEPLALILTGVLLHPCSEAHGSVLCSNSVLCPKGTLWSPGCFSFLQEEKVHPCAQAEGCRYWSCVTEK